MRINNLYNQKTITIDFSIVGETCHICFDEYREADITNKTIHILSCNRPSTEIPNHFFHLTCIRMWLDRQVQLKQSMSCPLCETEVEIAPLLETDGPEIRFQNAVIMDDLNTVMALLDSISADNLWLNLELALQNGSLDIVNAIIASNQFQHISIHALGYGLPYASRNGRLEIVNAIIASNQFQHISIYDLGESLMFAFEYDHPDIVNAIIGSGRFQDISIHHLGGCLLCASQNGSLDIVNAIIASDRFQDISINDLGYSLQHASRYGRLNSVNAIIASNRFQQIPIDYLKISIQEAFENGHTAIRNLLLRQMLLHQMITTISMFYRYILNQKHGQEF